MTKAEDKLSGATPAEHLARVADHAANQKAVAAAKAKAHYRPEEAKVEVKR